MSGPRVSDLTEITTLAADDLLVVVDTSENQSKKCQAGNLNPGEIESTQTADYTITRDNEVVFCSGTLTVTLPAASNAWKVMVANIGTGVVTIERAGSDQIMVRGGATGTSYILANQGDTVTLRANGGLIWLEW